MAIDYTQNLDLILNELCVSTPATVAKLEALRVADDNSAAFYAAFVVLCLQIDADRYGIDDLDNVTFERVKGYTYFDYLQGYPLAWDRLEEVLSFFRIELKAFHNSK